MPGSLAIFTSIELLIVTWFDFKTNKIKNFWAIINLGFFFIFLFIFPQYFKFSLLHFLWPSLMLLTGFVLYILKIMGAGDSKFIFSLMLIIPTEEHTEYLLYLLCSTIVIAPIYLLHRKFQIGRWSGGKNIFAPVILLAWVGLIWMHFLKN